MYISGAIKEFERPYAEKNYKLNFGYMNFFFLFYNAQFVQKCVTALKFLLDILLNFVLFKAQFRNKLHVFNFFCNGKIGEIYYLATTVSYLVGSEENITLKKVNKNCDY